MKTYNQITHLLRMLFSVAAVATLAACTTDVVERVGGEQPDKGKLENTYGMLRSNTSIENTVDLLLTEGDNLVSDNVYYQLTQPTPADQKLEMRVDGSLLDQYNKDHTTKLLLLPEANYEFPDGKTLAVAQGAKSSKQAHIKFLANGLAAGEYLLPVTVATAGADPKLENQTLYYQITLRARQAGDNVLDTEELYTEADEVKPLFLVFYLNTRDYQPLLLTEYFMLKKHIMPAPQVELWYRAIGNIINLRTVVLGYDASSQRAKLNLGADMTYVLSHARKYIWPLQESGRKVCLCLEGGGTGLGFCNMNDAQIADFVAQVKIVVNNYNLDGINLWDRNSGYGKEGMAAVNTTSYPKLIVALRAALGKERLLTVTDHEAPTESFHDTAATGGIEVGQYIDYAWSGYNDENEPPQIVDPYHQGADDVSTTHPRKPIAGLDPSKYGCINAPWYSKDSPVINQEVKPIVRWKLAKNKQSNILVFIDLRTILQDKYEGVWSMSNVCVAFADDGIINTMKFRNTKNRYTHDISPLTKLPGGRGYGKWLKDW